MTDHPCEACSRPAPDRTLCTICTDKLIAEIASVCAYHGLAHDLDIAVTKQAKFRPSPGGRSYTDEPPPMFDERASDAAGHLKAALAKWARVIIDETGAGTVPTLGPTCHTCPHRSCREIRTRGLPSDTLTSIAAWLCRRARWLAHHHQAGEAYTEIVGAVRAARITVDRPNDRVYAGPCDCGRDLYAKADARWAICRAKDHGEAPLMWPVDERRTWLLDQAADYIGTTTEISAALSRYAKPVTPAVIRGHVNRGNLRPVWSDGRRRALYRLGDVLDVVVPSLAGQDAA